MEEDALAAEVEAGWREESAGWIKHHELMTRWTADATRLVVDAARAAPGERALDLAGGTGRVAFALASDLLPGGSVVSSDLVEPMVRGAERIGKEAGVPNVSYQRADASDLPFPDGSFDVVTCLHGVMFFARLERSLAEIRRVLVPGGRVVFLVWGPPERNPFLTTLAGPFLRRLPGAAPLEAEEIGPFRFAREGTLSTALIEAAFERVAESVHEIDWDFPGNADEMWRDAREISSSLFEGMQKALAPAEYAAASAEVLAALRERDDGKKVRFRATMVLVVAQRPR